MSALLSRSETPAPTATPTDFGVRRALYATALFFIVVFLVMGGLFAWRDHQAAIDLARVRTEDLSRILEQYADRVFDVNHLIARQLQEVLRERATLEGLGEDRNFRALLSNLVRNSPTLDNILVTTPDGIPVAFSDLEEVPRVDLGDRSWVRAHQSSDLPFFVSEAIQSRITGELLFTYSVPVRDDEGRLIAIVAIGARSDFIEALSLRDDPSRDVILTVYSANGRVMARTGMTPDRIGWRIPADDPMLTAPAGVQYGSTIRPAPLDNVERVISWRQLPRWPVVVTASVSTRDVLEQWYAGLTLSAAMFALVLSVAGWLVWLGVRAAEAQEADRAALARTNARLTATVRERDLLIREIHHRVKNNLQVTVSLLMLQAARVKEPHARTAFTETQDRLRSVALVHETLYQTHQSDRVELSDYIRRVVDGLSQTHGAESRGIEVGVRCDPILLDHDRALPFALVLTEVLVNALKHAFPEGRVGRIEVALRRSTGNLHLTVLDDGVGLHQHEGPRDSLGMVLIETLCGQIGATFRFQVDGGTRFQMDLPDC